MSLSVWEVWSWFCETI